MPALALLFCLLAMPLLAVAELPRVLVVGGENTYHWAVFAAMRQALARDSAHYELVYRTVEQYRSDSGSRPVLRVAVGVAAARTLSAAREDAPLLCVLLPRDDYLALARSAGTEMSGLFLEQPLSRYLALLRLALPQRDQVGAVLGPVSAALAADLRQAGERQRLQITTASITAERELTAAMEQVMRPSGVLLALPDPVVVNADTARTLIMTAYHRGIALVGYSQALAKAGALMAVHSTPEQFGQDAGEMVRAALSASPVHLPPARHPAYFTVSVNYQVARALELNLPPEDRLAALVRQQEVAQ
ncbi:ABC transporter substrate-binding protein [Sulfurivermis fontis]|uniref:ABC transporter substrate-binding protein n=1 Tax=Sulfurivermis fontis TaxID=1972068 RepID=UPI0015585934|nr:ABC transporter substrate binding protein [Sulfurivermis fontis]